MVIYLNHLKPDLKLPYQNPLGLLILAQQIISPQTSTTCPCMLLTTVVIKSPLVMVSRLPISNIDLGQLYTQTRPTSIISLP